MSLKTILKPSEPFHIENVVATSSLNQKINLEKIKDVYPLSKYVPSKFPGVIVRQKNVRTIILVFKSGSIVCTGTKSERLATEAIRRFVFQIKDSIKLKNIRCREIKIENIVASGNFGNKIHIEQTARKLPRSLYEPDQFPGVIHRLSNPRTVVLIFASGKLVCTGAKSFDEVKLSINSLKMELEKQNLIFKPVNSKDV